MSSVRHQSESGDGSVEAIVPVHHAARPVGRTVQSLLMQRESLRELQASLRITVVCHNIAAPAIREVLGLTRTTADVSLREYSDDVRSPAGPKNFALSSAQAEFVTFVDSDDYLEPGSLAAWLTRARDTGAAAVLAPVRTPHGTILATPGLRPSKPTVLDPLKDGLATRSLPFGLLRVSSLQQLGFRFTEGLSVGEDLEPTLRLLFSGHVISYPYGSPAYRQTDDAAEGRVTATLAPLGEEFRWLGPLTKQGWLLALPLSHRRSIALKLMRIHGIGALLRRGEAIAQRAEVSSGAGLESAVLWDANEQQAWRSFQREIENLAEGALATLSRRDAQLAETAGATDDPVVLAAARSRYQVSNRRAELMTKKLGSVMARESIIRHYIRANRRRAAHVFDSRAEPIG
jgi:hypothetical protein